MMPAGKFYIGDLCYVMHTEWDEFCEITISGPKVLDGEFALKDGRKFATYGTMYGDGNYAVLGTGARVGVDAGLIGCIRLEDIDTTNPQNDITLGYIVDFEDEFETGETDGTIWFGDVQIETGNSEDYQEDDTEDGYYD